MPHCPNPECRHRLRTGKPAEYQPGMDNCADCGSELAAGGPPRPTRGPSLGWPKPLVQRLVTTALVLLLVWMASYLPHPLLDPEALDVLGAQGVVASPMVLGLRPLIAAFILVELGALAYPGTRQRRRTDPSLRTRLWLLAALLGIGIAWLQGISLALTLEMMNGYHGWSAWGTDIVPNPGGSSGSPTRPWWQSAPAHWRWWPVGWTGAGWDREWQPCCCSRP